MITFNLAYWIQLGLYKARKVAVLTAPTEAGKPFSFLPVSISP